MSQTFSIPTWTEENRNLHDVICQARVSKEAADNLSQLLHLNKEKFLNLLDNEPKNPAHRNTLNTNKAYINRTSHNVNKEFVTKALFLSDQLDINEYVAATLLMRGTAEFSRVSSNAIDTAVLLFHAERGYLLACLDAILKSAKDASTSEQVRSICQQFISELLKERMENGGTFVTKILSTLDHLSKTINSIINTGSAVGQLPAAGSGKLGEDISELRIERLGDERVYIVQILYHITSLFNIDTNDKIKMLEMLEEAELSDPATAYMIIAMISTLSAEATDEMTPSPATLKFVDDFHHRIMTHGSKVPVIKATIVLQWILYLSDPARAADMIGVNGRTEAEIQELLESSIATDVFRFMSEYLLYFQQPNAIVNTSRKAIKQDTQNNTTKTIDIADYHNFSADIRSDFQPFVIYELEKMSILVISTLFGTLQKLKYKEEDTNIPVQTPLTTDSALLTKEPSADQCHDLEYFLTFLASVFRNRVNDGAVFWNREQGGLHHFARWLLDIKVVNTVCAAFDFFASITTGDICAANMYTFFKAGMEATLGSSALFSWGKPLAALQFYADLLKEVSDDSRAVIPEAEEQLIIKFLAILRGCVQYSSEARAEFWRDQNIGCKAILINILNCPTSINLRAALFNVLAAFCSAWGGGINDLGRQISTEVWSILGDSDVLLSTRKAVQDRPQSVYQAPGILQELEAEKSSRVYIETLSIIRLIGSAIHTQSKREKLVSGFEDAKSSIPSDLRKDSKQPGAIPFISLIVDDIFVALGSQKYSFAEARWELTEACLTVMENSIESFDLKVFDNEHIRQNLEKELKVLSINRTVETQLLHLLIHPGFQIIIRILSGSKVIDELFSVIDECAKEKTKETESMPYHKKCLVRSLRILLNVLKLQNTFCNILIPYINGFAKKKATSEFQLGGYTFSPLPSVVPLGQLALFHSNILSRIGLLVDYEDQEEICFLSTKILNLLSVDPKEADPSNELVLARSATTHLYSSLGVSVTNLLSSSKYADAIIFGASERLSISIPEVTSCDDYEYDINNIPFWRAEETLKNTFNYPTDLVPRLSSSVRLAILDLLLENTQQATSPTLAEFLLGYQLSGNPINKLQDTESNKATLVCFHAILDMLRQGIDTDSGAEDAMVEDTAEPTEPLVDTHPILAEKCYELIYKLCAKKSLSLATMRYLRNHENFFYKQFNTMSARLEHNIGVQTTSIPGKIVCADGSTYDTDFFKLKSKLHQRAWLMQSIALELHSTAGMRQNSETSKLLELLYGRRSIVSEDDTDMVDQAQEHGIFSSSNYQQPLVKMLEFVSSLEFTWVDGLTEGLPAPELNYFAGLNPTLFKITNNYGCQLYDITAIFKKLREAQRTNYRDHPDNDAIELEIGSILSHTMAENHKSEINHGRLHCLTAWKEVVHITLAECFNLIDAGNRETIIYELLGMLLSKLMHTKSYDQEMLKNMNDVVLALVNQLRKEKVTRPASQLPIEKLGSVFTGIVNYICDSSSDIFIRGDMYSAMTSFLLYIKDHGKSDITTKFENFIIDHVAANDTKLLKTICGDAINGLDIWKTTAYIALDSLNTMALSIGSTVVQSFLIQQNFLQYAIDMIRTDDAALSNLLEQTDAPLLPLYIFEAKMSILLRLAMNPEGAELLFTNRIFDVLGQCQFIKAQVLDPTTTEISLESSVELADRYQQLIMPILRLIMAILCSYGGKNHQVLWQTETWVRRQQSALVNILKYERRQLTLASLEQIKMVTSIMYFISCRKGYTKDFTIRGINQIHNNLIQLEIPDSLASSVIPTTSQESAWDKTPVKDGESCSVLQAKATKFIRSIKKNVEIYTSQK